MSKPILNGIDANTIDNMQLDAGVIIKDAYDPTSDENGLRLSSILKSSSIGATKGATTFSAIPEIRNIFDGIDGVRGDIKDGNVIDKWEVTLKTSVTAFTLENLKIALGTSNPTDNPKYSIIEPKEEISTSDYINITWLGTMAKGSDPIVINLNNCLNMNGLTVTAEDKNTGLIEIELRAHIDLEHTQKQFKIYLPKNSPGKMLDSKELKLNK